MTNQIVHRRSLVAIPLQVRVLGVAYQQTRYLDAQVKGWLQAYWEVPSVVHYPSMLQAVREIQQKVWVDRLEAVVEAHIETTARVREACGIPGTSVKTAYLCRDKPAMKNALRDAGIPCAQVLRGTDPKEVLDFAQRVGFPLILKPIAGAGAADTVKVNSMDELKREMAASHLSPERPTAVEEFIEGHEGFVDTLTVNGEVTHEFVTHYYPNVLEAMRKRWISPQMVATNRLDEPGYKEVRVMARRVIEALEIGTSATHFPPPGTPTQPVAGGYMANPWVRARHPDYDGLRDMLNTIGQTVKVLAA